MSPVLCSIATLDLLTNFFGELALIGKTHLSRLSLDVTVSRLIGIVGGSFDVEP